MERVFDNGNCHSRWDSDCEEHDLKWVDVPITSTFECMCRLCQRSRSCANFHVANGASCSSWAAECILQRDETHAGDACTPCRQPMQNPPAIFAPFVERVP